ncbi:MAG: family 10 glycosylhydrolase [Planctomycetes bacterium]|nr:family 10 glycosylhydrolase [Planctomycetota bacterium]
MRLAPALALCALASLTIPNSYAQDGSVLFKPPDKELRAVTLSASDGIFASQAEIAKAMQTLADARFNVVLPCVWDGAYTLWHSPKAKETFGEDCDPAYGERDVLAEVLFEAHRVGLEVVPCFEAGFTAKGALLDKHPEWAALASDGKPLVLGGERWADALDPQVQQFFLDLVLELARNYDLDGIAGSQRFPALPATAAAKPAQRELYLKAGTGGSSTDPKDEKWCAWRTQQLSAFAARVSGGLNPALEIVLMPHLAGAGPREWLQDPPAWIERKLAHALVLAGDSPSAEAESKRIDALLADPCTRRTSRSCAAAFRPRRARPAPMRPSSKPARATTARRSSPARSSSARALLANEAALAVALADEPYDYPMVPPWRDAEGWRPVPIQTRPQAGSGKWQFPASDGPMVMTLDGTLAGEASWTARVPVAGTYDVYTWIAPDQSLGEIAKYKLAAKNGLQTIQLRVGPAACRGWRRVGEVVLPENEEFEVARFDAIEKDGTKVSAVGPLLLLLDRTAGRR